MDVKKWLVVVLFIACILVAGCGDNPQSHAANPTVSSPPPPAPAATSWLNASDDGVRFLRWTEANGTLSGTWQSANLSDGKLVYPSGTVTGTKSGQNITLSFTYQGQIAMSSTGTLAGDALTLETPGDNGASKHVVYHPASEDEYNQKLAAFKAAHGG